jgi:hypothetical protein
MGATADARKGTLNSAAFIEVDTEWSLSPFPWAVPDRSVVWVSAEAAGSLEVHRCRGAADAPVPVHLADGSWVGSTASLMVRLREVLVGESQGIPSVPDDRYVPQVDPGRGA